METNNEAPKFTAELKAKWLEALRSGEFKQGKSRLVDCGRYCCLGVLAAVSDFTSDSGIFLYSDKLRQVGNGDAFLDSSVQSRLANFNDEGRPFAEIADYIEANIPAVE